MMHNFHGQSEIEAFPRVFPSNLNGGILSLDTNLPQERVGAQIVAMSPVPQFRPQC